MGFLKNKSALFRWTFKISLILLGLVIIFLSIYHKEVFRVYKVITLFDRDVVVENFRSMGSFFDTKTVHKGSFVHALQYDRKPLPESYRYKNEEKKIADFIDRTWTTGMIVLKDGKVVFEEYYRGNNATTKSISWSMSKSFISALLGIAVAEGHIKNIMQPVTDYAPILKGTGYDGVPIKHVLQMSSGILFNEDYADFYSDINRMGRTIALSTPLDDFVASLKNERKSGNYNHYVSMDTQVLGMVLREATGETMTSYLENKIWKKIGMESDAYWLVDRNRMEMVFGCLNAVLRDYARMGQLYLNEGMWNGEQIVPKEWVRASITPDGPHLQPGKNPASNSVLGYGYQWWIPENPEGDFLAIGIYNQFIYIHPKNKVVIAKTSAYPDYNTDGNDKELESIAMFKVIANHLAR